MVGFTWTKKLFLRRGIFKCSMKHMQMNIKDFAAEWRPFYVLRKMDIVVHSGLNVSPEPGGSLVQ